MYLNLTHCMVFFSLGVCLTEAPCFEQGSQDGVEAETLSSIGGEGTTCAADDGVRFLQLHDPITEGFPRNIRRKVGVAIPLAENR